jgi:hypothetical protein
MGPPMPYEAALPGEPNLLLILAVLVVVVLVGQLLFRLGWRLVTLTSIVIIAFYVGTVVIPTLLDAA